MFKLWLRILNVLVFLTHLFYNCHTHTQIDPGEEDAAEFATSVFSMAHLHHLLEQHFQTEDVPKGLFAVTSKLHWLCHAALLSKYISPRLTWCFQGGDFMRCSQCLAQSCLAGNTLPSSLNKMMQHWRIAAHLQSSQKID